MIDKKLENVEYLDYMDSTITNDAPCAREIKSKIATGKVTLSEKKTFFHKKTGLKFQEETSKVIHLEHGFESY
jgi:hypothetical protein